MRDPSFSILYADLKAGKTSDMLAAFPQGVYIAAPGALSPAEDLWGFEQPKRYDLETFQDVARFAEGLVPGHVALGLDDATLIADRTAAALAKRGLGGWDLWGVVLRQAIDMRDTLRRRGVHVAMTSHPIVAEVKNGVRQPGGPSFQGQCRQKIPAAADLLLRAEARAGAGGKADVFGGGSSSIFGWHMVYRTGYSPDWLQGSRYNTPDRIPMNLREILRLARFHVPRLRGLEWLDSVADTLANRLLDVGLGDQEKVRDAILRVKDACLSKVTKFEPHVYWALRDGYDRAVLHVASKSVRSAIWGGI